MLPLDVSAPAPELKRARIDNFPSDEEFIQEFLRRDYVFDLPYSQYQDFVDVIPRNLISFHREGNSRVFIIHRHNKYMGSITNSFGKNWVLTLYPAHHPHSIDIAKSSLAELIEETVNAISQIEGHSLFQFTPVPGIVKPKTKRLKPFLQTQPLGTFLIQHSYDDSVRAFIKSENNQVIDILIGVYNTPNLTQDYESLNRFFIDKIIDYNQRSNVIPANVSDRLKLCSTFLDLTPLTGLNPTHLKRLLDKLDESHFIGVKLVDIGPSSSCNDNPLICYLDICIQLAKLGKLDFRIDFQKSSILNRYNVLTPLGQVKQHLDEIHQQLSGEGLAWALDRYYEVLFYKTLNNYIPSTQLPPVIPNMQEFFDNKELGADIQVKLRDSSQLIYAHKVLLGMFSEQLKARLFGKFSDTKSETLMFPEYSDQVVNELLRVIYGFKPDFEKCSLFELLKLADDLFSPLFMNLVSEYLTDKFRHKKVEVPLLVEIIKFGFWKKLPEKNEFFKYISDHWSEVIDYLPENEQMPFRMEFFNDWLTYLTPKTENLSLIKV